MSVLSRRRGLPKRTDHLRSPFQPPHSQTRAGFEGLPMLRQEGGKECRWLGAGSQHLWDPGQAAWPLWISVPFSVK